jgi:quinohemoprotein ethanol dehydrogenase
MNRKLQALGLKKTTVLVVVLTIAWSGQAIIAQRSANKVQAVPESREWPIIGGDLTNARFSPLTQINRTNVMSLAGAWVSEEFDGGSQSRATPVIENGHMYVTAGPWIYQLNATTGETIWKIRADERPLPQGMNLMNPGAQAEALKTDRRLPSASGVGLGDGMVFAGLTGGEVTAFSQKTGKPVWTTQIGDSPPPKGQGVSGVPVYWNGTVFAGLANGDFGLRGRVVALDAKTGRKMWEFFTVPGPGEAGHETWQQDNDVWKTGGGGVWLIGCVDPDLGLVYFGTGNTVPMTGGEVRGGNNLYTDSVIALDTKTGKLRWHYQLVHHDIWDADVAVAPVLYDTQIGGRARRAVAAVRSDGYIFLLDRENGKPILPVEERPVAQDPFQKTSPTQPYPVGADSIIASCEEWKEAVKPPAGFVLGCQYTPVSFDSNFVAPSFGVRVAPISFSPQTGYFYAAAGANLNSRRRLSKDPYFVSVAGPRVPALASYAAFTAIDSRTGRAVWKKEIPPGTVGRSGVLSTAGGLLFRAAGDGNVTAYDAKTGDTLWQFQIGVQGGGGPLASYELYGEQYLAVSAGRRVWAFKLNGSVPPAGPLPGRSVAVADGGFTGSIENTNSIETASMLTDMAITGTRYAFDEHTFNPTRARVKVGTPVVWTNNGLMPHTIVAQDGSWTVGKISPALTGTMTFSKSGNYTYICKDHPWAVGQVIVVE